MKGDAASGLACAARWGRSERGVGAGRVLGWDWVLARPRWAAAGQAGVERAGQGLGPRGEERGGELGRPGEREREEEADRVGLGSGP